jgi:hypothetical protein
MSSNRERERERVVLEGRRFDRVVLEGRRDKVVEFK